MKKKIESRPWGDYIEFTRNEPTTVKILTIYPNEGLSLQYHLNRQEFWKVLEGNPQITIGDTVVEGHVGDEFFVEKKVPHRIAAGKSRVEILEIAFGEAEEGDIVRLDDRYGRITPA